MHDYHLLLLLVLSYNSFSDSVLSALKENVRSLLDSSRAESGGTPMRGLNNYLQDKNQDDEKGKKPVQKDADLKKMVSNMSPLKMTATTTRTEHFLGRSYFHVDPVFDSLKNRRLWQKSKFKEVKSSSTSSSEMEMQFWMEDWDEQKKVRKIEALNTSRPPSDVLNMKMARPHGIPCGDPNQHDLPWGSCMRPVECEEEFRIHRGDWSCGRTQYICCAIMDTAYDMYQAHDMSFEHDNSQTSDSDDALGYRDTHEEKLRERLRRKHEKSKRKRTKNLLKKKIRHSITSVITEITKLLQKAYRNATSLRIKKAKELMEFIKKMKKEYRNNRQNLVAAHEFDLLKYDLVMEESLKKIRGVNQAFMANQTFRDIVINGTLNKEALRKLQRTDPIITMFYKNRRMGGESAQTEKEELELERESTETGKEELEVVEELSETGIEEPKVEKVLLYQRSELEEDKPKSKKRVPKLLDYDVEYGMLYY